MTDEPEVDTASLPLTPEARAIAPDPRGYPVTLADGQEWRLAYAFYTPLLDKQRDELADHAYTDGMHSPSTILYCAFCLLRFNYNLTQGEVGSLLGSLEPAAASRLSNAVITCIVGPDPEKMRRTYSEWVMSALLANGLKPKDIPAEHLPGVLMQLEKTGRIVHPSDFISAARSAKNRAELLKGD